MSLDKRKQQGQIAGGGSRRPRPTAEGSAIPSNGAGPSKPDSSAAAPRPAPSFLSSLQNEEVDFPRGGGTTLTALELKQTRDEGRREAEEDANAESSQRASKRQKRPVSEREAKRLRKTGVDEERKERDKDIIRVEQLNYKRLVPGTRLLTRIHSILPLHLILSLPNNLLAHVPITEISSTLSSLLQAEQDAMSVSDDEDPNELEDEEKPSSAPDLATLFRPGQYFPAKVISTYPTASQSFVSQYPSTETVRLAARVELSLMPSKINSEVARADLEKGYWLVGEVKSEEDRGYRIGLGVDETTGTASVEGWLEKKELPSDQPIIIGQLIPAVISSVKAGGRVLHLSLDHQAILRSQLSEVSNVASILPGHQVSVLVTAVVSNGLNVKICGFFDGTIDLTHLGLGEAEIEEKHKVGKKIRARIIYDTLTTTPRHFGLSVLPHILSLDSPSRPGSIQPLEKAVKIGETISAVTVIRVVPDWGLLCRAADGLEGFVHISHTSNERIPTLSGNTGPYRTRTIHRARVIGHSPLDGVALFSLEQKVLDQVFMQVDDLKVGQALKGTIRRLTDKVLFVDVQGSVDGVVFPLHYADIRLKHPEKRFKIGATVRARVFALDPARNRVLLTLKKSLVDSQLPIPESVKEVQRGQVVAGVVSKIADKGCLVDLFGGIRAFIPLSQASESYVTDLKDIFFVGKSLNIRITSIDYESAKIVGSVRQVATAPPPVTKGDVGDDVSGTVTKIHTEQVVLTLSSGSTALLSLSNLSNHRHMGVEELRTSLKVGETLDDLVVVSKNETTGLLIVANKRPSSGLSQTIRKFDAVQSGQTMAGRVESRSEQGIVIELAHHLRGRIHPCDISDDLSVIDENGLPKVGEEVSCYVIDVNHGRRGIDLSTRLSRTQPDSAPSVMDPEINTISDLKGGTLIRGLVKNIAKHGVFVALGRNVTARIMIKELFDEFVQDWESQFKVNQLVSGKILSVDVKRNLVEMTLRKTPASRGSKQAAKLRLSDFEEGQKVVATVKKIETYGMFIHIESSDVSGLCHRSELSDNAKQDVTLALKGFREGDQVKAKIVSIDREKNKINFSIKPSHFSDEFVQSLVADKGEAASGAELEDGSQSEDDAEETREDGHDEEDVINLGDPDSDEEEDDDVEKKDGNEVEDVSGEEGAKGDEDAISPAEESSEEEDLTIEMSAPVSSAGPSNRTATKVDRTASALSVIGGFDFSGRGTDIAQSADSSSDEDDAAVPESSAKAIGKKRPLEDLTATAPDAKPESASDFERALLASPNSSFLWIQYMSFLLQLHEVEKARRLGRQALEKIAYREEEEKLNVWMALINLELGFGTEDSADKVFREASQFNDARTVYLRYADALQAAAKDAVVEELLKKMVKKFSAHVDSWARFAEYYLKKGDVDAARELLPRSLQSLDKTKHVEMVERLALLEFRLGEVERGKTLVEGLVDRYPKRLDLWSVYIDQLAKQEDIQGCRGLFDRALQQKLTIKKAKFLFKKWLSVESRIGDSAGQEKAKENAREWVQANAKVERGDGDGEEDE